MNITLKALLTTAVIFGIPSVFASDAEFLGSGAQSDYGMTTTENSSRESIATHIDRTYNLIIRIPSAQSNDVDQKLKAANGLMRLDLDDAYAAASNIYTAVGADSSSTVDQKLKAAQGLRNLSCFDKAVAIEVAVCNDPATELYQKLEIAGRLITTGKGYDAEAAAIYRKVAEYLENRATQANAN